MRVSAGGVPVNGRGDPPAITFCGVTKRYGGQVALEPTDLEIEEGEFFCLLGPSGCGKTTTLNLVGGFVAPTSGEILIRGANVNRLPPYRRAVNTVFQNYALFPHMTVRDNVGFGLKMAGTRASSILRSGHSRGGRCSRSPSRSTSSSSRCSSSAATTRFRSTSTHR